MRQRDKLHGVIKATTTETVTTTDTTTWKDDLDLEVLLWMQQPCKTDGDESEEDYPFPQVECYVCVDLLDEPSVSMSESLASLLMEYCNERAAPDSYRADSLALLRRIFDECEKVIIQHTPETYIP